MSRKVQEIQVKCSVCGKALGDFLPEDHIDLHSTECSSCLQVTEMRRAPNRYHSKNRHEQEFWENEHKMELDSLAVCDRCEQTQKNCTCEDWIPRSTIDDSTIPEEEEENYDEDY